MYSIAVNLQSKACVFGYKILQSYVYKTLAAVGDGGGWNFWRGKHGICYQNSGESQGWSERDSHSLRESNQGAQDWKVCQVCTVHKLVPIEATTSSSLFTRWLMEGDCKSYSKHIQLPLLSIPNVVSPSYQWEEGRQEDWEICSAYRYHQEAASWGDKPDVQLMFSLSMLQRYNLKWRSNQKSDFIETLEHLLIPRLSLLAWYLSQSCCQQ